MEVIVFLSIFMAGELVSWLVFRKMNRSLVTSARKPVINPIIKGIVERLTLYLGLVHGYPQIIIAFGAFKIATRLRDSEEDDRVSNDYFLIGNLISLFFVMSYAISYTFITGL